MTSSPSTTNEQEANLGLYDGEVRHEQINWSIAAGRKTVLLGEQTRLPYFPDDERLFKLHAGDPLVLLLWKVLKKIPDNLREALLDAPLSLTLVRSDSLLFFENYRCHQALHIGCRRRTIYLPEILLHAAEERGYDYWALAEGLIYTSWMLLDYLLLVDIIKAYSETVSKLPNYRLGEALQLKLIERHNTHRRDSVDANRSELGEFADAYRACLLTIKPADAAQGDPFALARALFDPEREKRWAQDKMERIAQVFDYPKLFLFDRDIIHGAARELAISGKQSIEPLSFADALHDYRDSMRFERRPLKTTLGKSIIPKPRAVFLQTIVGLGARGLRGFFVAYAESEDSEVRDLMHPLWMYLCSLSSDPAGVFSRMGRCRAIGREGLDEDGERYLAGVLIRLDKAENYGDIAIEVGKMGEVARAELEGLVRAQRMVEEDEWEVFKSRKQKIVTRACVALDSLDGVVDVVRKVNLHEDELVCRLLQDRPHRLTSDPSGVMMYIRTYKNSLQRFGADDQDSDFMLASILVRLDKSEHYSTLLEHVFTLGTPALTALHNVFDQIPERDMERREILKQARILWGRLLAQTRARARRS
ncbi:MAG: hypothetical protein ACKVJG_05300 [Candidatus Latescibacterota bacterium]